MAFRMAGINYAPDLDSSWQRAPGTLYDMAGFAPVQRNQYATVGRLQLSAGLRAITDADISLARIFRQHDGTLRFLVFRRANAANTIDEFDVAGVRTNRYAGGGAALEWDACSWGNQVIATSHGDGVLTSTGAGFTALGGSPLQAKYIAANANFVMLANLWDGGANFYYDTVQWCGAGNPATWSTSIATQAGRYPVRDAPGPITGIAAFRNMFVVFKEDSVHVGRYVGVQQNVFGFECIATRVGTPSRRSICELDNKLYFAHTTGVWEFDGQSLRNVSLPVWTSILTELGRTTQYADSVPPGTGGVGAPSGSFGPGAIASIRCTGDDVEGILHVFISQSGTTNGENKLYHYAYNARTQKWSRVGNIATGAFASGGQASPVVATSSELYGFFNAGATPTDPRVVIVGNATASYRFFGIGYPLPADTSWLAPYISAGNFGSIDTNEVALRAYVETASGSDTLVFGSGTLKGYMDAARTIADGSDAMSANTEFDTFDGKLRTRFVTCTLNVTNGKRGLIVNAGLDSADGGRRG